MRKFCATIIVLFIPLIYGCNNMASEPRPSQKNSDPMVASVNGEAIGESELHELLVKTHGKVVLEEMILLKKVHQEATRRGIQAGPERIAEELRLLLADMAPERSSITQQALLDLMLVSRRISRGQLNLILERQALLRQMVDQNVQVTAAMLAEEKQRLYGPKVTVRIIVVSTLRQIEQVDRKLRQGADFVDLVRRYSEDRGSVRKDGLLGPFSKVDGAIDKEIRQAAFGLDAIGSRSEIIKHIDRYKQFWWSILQLQEKIPAAETPLDPDEKDLEQTLRQRLLNQRMDELQKAIQQDSKHTIYHPSLH